MSRRADLLRLCTLAVVASAGALPASAGQDAAVYGSIIDRHGAPVGSVEITLSTAGGPARTQSDPYGQFSLLGLAPGPSGSISFEKPGFDSLACRVPLDPGHAPRLRIVLFDGPLSRGGPSCRVTDLETSDEYTIR